MTYHNPYSGASFFDFFWIFIARLCGFLTGQIPLSTLASDEIQIAVLVGVSLSAASIGCFLVLRRMTMLANAFSHTILLGIVIAYYLTTRFLNVDESPSHPTLSIHILLLASLAMGILTTFLTEFLTKQAKLQEDASIGMVFTSLFALGVILVTLLTRSAHIGTEVIMGNVDALSLEDLNLVATVLVMNSVLLFLFYKEYLITTFDSGLANALGISTLFFNYLLMMQV
ncbi:MAG: metal ABC transporter permease, partial [Parachlamydiaceae bacterium]